MSVPHPPRTTRLVAPWLALAASCAAELTGPTPAPTAATPAVVCASQQPATITVAGSGFAPLVTHGLEETPRVVLPTITLVASTDLAGTPSTASFRVPDSAAAPQVSWISAQELRFNLTPEMAVTPGLYDLRVDNAVGTTGTVPTALLVVPPPTVTALEPAAFCTAAGGELVVRGDFFLVLDGQLPGVKVGDTTVTPVLSDCRALPGASGAQACLTMTVTIAPELLVAGTQVVTIRNPAPADCASTETLSVEVVPPPTLATALPARLCASGGHLALTGTFLRPGSAVTLGTAAATAVTASTDGTQLDATFTGPLDDGGPFDVTVTTPESCSTTLADAVTIVHSAQLFFVDPPVAYAGLALQLTAYGTGLSADLTKVELFQDGTRVTLDFSWNPARPSRLLLDLPAGQAAGTWGLHLEDANGCAADLEEGLRIVDVATVEVTRVDPPFGWKDTDTGITVFAADPGAPFVPLPRVYLSAHGAATPTALGLESTNVLDAHALTAVVPKGLVPGPYDLIIVNPDGTLAVEESAFTVTAEPPPRITSLAPGSIPAGGTPSITVEGTGFRTPTAKLSCAQNATPDTILTSPVISVGTSSGTSLTGTFNGATLTSGMVCSVRVTNGDGTYADFALLKVTTSSENPFPPVLGKPLVTARRAPALVAARLNDASRYLVATGGDAGTEAGALATVESTPVSIFGVQSGWSTQRHALPQPRTLHGAAAVGRFVYVVGGAVKDAQGALSTTATVLRAALLSPDERPAITDLDLAILTPTTGLSPGTYSYRVSALLDGNDAFNPNGESLASEPFPVTLPDRPTLGGRRFALTLDWSAVQNAVAYRIYRAEWSTGSSADHVLVGEVAASAARRFVDEGATAGTEVPLPLGSLGTWNAVASLGTPRKGAAVAVVRKPDDAGANKWFVFAMGGRDAGGGALSSIERMTVEVTNAAGAQSTTGWGSAGGSLSTPRWQLGAFVGTRRTSTRIPAGKAFLWAGPGLDSAGTSMREIDGGEVTPDGNLSGFIEVARSTPRAGAGVAQAGNFLYLFGGNGASPDSTSISATICDASVAGGGCTVNTPPDITNPNSNGITLQAPRYLTGSILEGATIYLVGGADGASGAITSTEQLVW